MGMFYCSSLVSRKNSDQSAASTANTPKYDKKYDSFFAKGLIHTSTTCQQQDAVPNDDMDDMMHDDADVLIKRCKSSSMEDEEDDHRCRDLQSAEALSETCSKSCRNGHEAGNGAKGQRTKHGKKHCKVLQEDERFLRYFKWSKWMRRREDWPLFLLSPTNYLRILCVRLTDHAAFDYVIMIFILANCVTLAMERPQLAPNSMERELLMIANYVFTAVFAFEMAVKVIANGLMYGRKAYLKSGWNVMDAALVAVSLFDLFLTIIAQKSPRIFGILRVFRLLRSLRPLRYVRREREREKWFLCAQHLLSRNFFDQ